MAEPTPYASYDQRWRAVQSRDEQADGHFFYVVRTTGVYSRPSCVARSARRENVLFCSTADEARAAGYRACRRCRPDGPGLNSEHAAAVMTACRVIDRSAEPPSLDELARAVGFSRFHFHRVFKALTGVTPHDYLSDGRARRVRRELSRAESVSDAIYGAGFNSNGHFYAMSAEVLGMTPTAFRSGGSGATIRAVEGKCSLGPVLVAVADKGVCAVLHGEDHGALRRRLVELFPMAQFAEPGPELVELVGEALHRSEPPARGRALLAADVLGVALHQRVRRALRGVPAVVTARR